LFGGGSLFHTFLDKGLVDTVEVGLIPALLGGNCTAARSGQTREPDIVGLALIQKQRRIDADLRIEIG
jgi:riboflavin biosynthesis pyrimidine reductase